MTKATLFTLMMFTLSGCYGSTDTDQPAGSAGSSGSAGASGSSAGGGGGTSGSGGGTSGSGGSAGIGGTGGSSGTCPDPNDPKVHYVSTDPNECAAIDFACQPAQEYFGGECGCGCIDVCPDENDPDVSYISHDPKSCAASDWACPPDTQSFDNSCGCGCISTTPCSGLSEAQCTQSQVCMPVYQGICDCSCPNNEPGCAGCPAYCFEFTGCGFSGE